MIQKHEIEKMELLLIEAIKSSNVPFLMQVIHDDLLCIAPDGQTVTKEMDMSAHRSGAMQVDLLIPTQEDISIIGDTATSIILYETKGRMLGNPIAGTFKYLRVWKKFDTSLKVIAATCTKVS